MTVSVTNVQVLRRDDVLRRIDSAVGVRMAVEHAVKAVNDIIHAAHKLPITLALNRLGATPEVRREVVAKLISEGGWTCVPAPHEYGTDPTHYTLS
jgi:hypothetical protein